jgi:hypothetical protein
MWQPSCRVARIVPRHRENEDAQRGADRTGHDDFASARSAGEYDDAVHAVE